MPRLILQFEDRVLKEFVVGPSVTIGRLPDNTVIIDNPAVSSHHACISRDGGRFVVDDLQSTNGTFVNEKRVTRHALRNGDVVLVGKHKLVFDEMESDEAVESIEPAEPVLSNLGDTIYLDTVQHRALLSKLGAPSASPAKVGMLRVLAGRADQEEFHLDAHTSVIGAADTNLVRLKGWFKPKVAVAITRKADHYAATLLGGTTLINGQRLKGRFDLKDGDILRVSGLTLQFRLREAKD
jgi:pSer/pThr/pTyr-binding forkhead associated (FHA) protein